jgi:hypothetical protein
LWLDFVCERHSPSRGRSVRWISSRYNILDALNSSNF